VGGEVGVAGRRGATTLVRALDGETRPAVSQSRRVIVYHVGRERCAAGTAWCYGYYGKDGANERVAKDGEEEAIEEKG